MTEAALENKVVSLTENAATRIKTLVEMEGNPALNFRIAITGGGCSGFSYNFKLDDAINDDDQVFDYFGIKVIVDTMSLDLVSGAEVDFVEDLIGSSFRVNNPVATSSCGCGTSFGI